MGIFGDIFQRVKDDLKYSAESNISEKIHGGIEKIKDRSIATKCPKCKKEIENEDLKFCQNCGAKLKHACKKCEIYYPLGTKFCAECGGALK